MDIAIIASCAVTTAAGVLGRGTAQRVMRWWHDSKDQIECAVRSNIPDEVITGRWQNGLATLSADQVVFQPRNSFGLRLNRGAPFVIHVLSTPKDTGRQPSLREAMRVDPSLRIVAVETATGPIELAVTSRGIQQLLRMVDQIAL
jgi:hypothetical protein